MKTTVEENPGSLLRCQARWKHSEALPGQRSWWSEGPGETSLVRSKVQALETEQQVFCGPQPRWLVLQGKWRPQTGLTPRVRRLLQAAALKKRWQEEKITPASQEALWILSWKMLFPGPTAMEQMVERNYREIRCGVRMWPDLLGYEQLLQNQRTVRSGLGKWLRIYFWNWGRIDGKGKSSEQA